MLFHDEVSNGMVFKNAGPLNSTRYIFSSRQELYKRVDGVGVGDQDQDLGKPRVGSVCVCVCMCMCVRVCVCVCL